MQRFFLVLVFAICLVLKAVTAAGAEAELSGDVISSSAINQSTDPTNLTLAQTEEITEPENNQSKNEDVSVVMTSKHQDSEPKGKVGITPMAGGSSFSGNWNSHISNSYTLGLGVEIPVGTNTAVELEGNYARYSIAYSSFQHGFDQYGLGLNGKYYLTRGTFEPYLGLGIVALDYDGMSHGPAYYYNTARYNQWVGAGQAFVGADVAVSPGVALGARGDYVLPLINRPDSAGNGIYAYPYYEEASAMGSAFFRVMGTVRLSL